MQKMTRRWFHAALAAFGLTILGCGGGGGGGGGTPELPAPPAPPPAPQNQAIEFADPGPVVMVVGAVLTNAASGGSGSGAIGYTIGDEAVASIDAVSGAVTALAAGGTTVTATKAADASFNEAQASYTLTVVAESNAVAAWIGSQDSIVSFSPGAAGATVIRSRDPFCDPDDLAGCDAGQSDVVSGNPITDTAATTGEAAYYSLQAGADSTHPALVHPNRFSPRIGHAVAHFNGRYWLIGGGQDPDYDAQVWSSADGRTWRQEATDLSLPATAFYSAIVFDGRLWLIGPRVHSSANGTEWVDETPGTPPFSGGNGFLSAAVFQDAMWVVFQGTAYASTNGQVWDQRSGAEVIGGRRQFASLTAHDDRLFLIAGQDFDGSQSGTSDVWASDDGIDWVQMTADAGFAPRYRHSAFVQGGRLWVMGGQEITANVPGAVMEGTWSSNDGITWIEETNATQIDRSYFTEVVEVAGDVTLVGGIMRGYSNHVWQSSDGVSWTLLSPHAAFTPRYANPGVVAFDGAMWLIGGAGPDTTTNNDVWRSVDGIRWERVAPSGSIFSPRSSHGVVVFDDRLWVIGGWDSDSAAGGTGTANNEVWSSADGIEWTQHLPASSMFSARYAHAVVVLGDRL